MALTTKKMKALAKRYQIGIYVGAITGFIAAYYTISQGYDLATLAESGKGLLDGLLGRNAAPVEVAKYKLYAAFILIGSTIGFYADMLIDKYGIVNSKRGRKRRK